MPIYALYFLPILRNSTILRYRQNNYLEKWHKIEEVILPISARSTSDIFYCTGIVQVLVVQQIIIMHTDICCLACCEAKRIFKLILYIVKNYFWTINVLIIVFKISMRAHLVWSNLIIKRSKPESKFQINIQVLRALLFFSHTISNST